jgi:CHAD domain-containing protein
VYHLAAAEPAAEAGDAEAVHRMRVATRRLRSDLRTFRPLLRDGWAGPLRAELKWLADVLGGLRDLDVLASRLREGTDADAEEALAPLLDDLDRRRDQARQRLREALSGPRYAALPARLVTAATAPELDPAEEAPGREVLPQLVARAWKKLKKRGRSLRRDDPDAAYHEVRIRVKRARYAAEAAAPALGRKAGRDARRFARAARAVQDVLGELHDAAVARDEIARAMAARPSDERFLAVADRLIHGQRRAAASARAAFRRAWRRLDRAKLRRWLRD